MFSQEVRVAGSHISGVVKEGVVPGSRNDNLKYLLHSTLKPSKDNSVWTADSLRSIAAELLDTADKLDELNKVPAVRKVPNTVWIRDSHGGQGL